LIDIPQSQIQDLAALCAEKKISRAEAVRQAVAAYLAEQRVRPKHDGFGLWADHTEDGLAYQERLRAEWDR